MLKARAGDVVILGLSKANIERLQEGKPIFFDATELGLKDTKILITYGETEAAIMVDLMTGSPTKGNA